MPRGFSKSIFKRQADSSFAKELVRRPHYGGSAT